MSDLSERLDRLGDVDRALVVRLLDRLEPKAAVTLRLDRQSHDPAWVPVPLDRDGCLRQAADALARGDDDVARGWMDLADRFPRPRPAPPDGPPQPERPWQGDTQRRRRRSWA